MNALQLLVLTSVAPKHQHVLNRAVKGQGGMIWSNAA